MSALKYPKVYSAAELMEISAREVALFRKDREKKEVATADFYHSTFLDARDAAKYVFEKTEDLLELGGKGQELLVGGYLETLRYMDRPTASADDFKNVSGTGTTAPSKFSDSALADAAVDFIQRNLNADLFPWLRDKRRADENEANAGITAIAALVAEQKTKTMLRTGSSHVQERLVRDALVTGLGYSIAYARPFLYPTEAPGRGEVFDKEALAGNAKADVVLGLGDGRFMCLECKVSNSFVNSYKRLNHEVLDKTVKWRGGLNELLAERT